MMTAGTWAVSVRTMEGTDVRNISKSSMADYQSELMKTSRVLAWGTRPVGGRAGDGRGNGG